MITVVLVEWHNYKRFYFHFYTFPYFPKCISTTVHYFITTHTHKVKNSKELSSFLKCLIGCLWQRLPVVLQYSFSMSSTEIDPEIFNWAHFL